MLGPLLNNTADITIHAGNKRSRTFTGALLSRFSRDVSWETNGRFLFVLPVDLKTGTVATLTQQTGALVAIHSKENQAQSSIQSSKLWGVPMGFHSGSSELAEAPPGSVADLEVRLAPRSRQASPRSSRRMGTNGIEQKTGLVPVIATCGTKYESLSLPVDHRLYICKGPSPASWFDHPRSGSLSMSHCDPNLSGENWQ